MIKAIIFDCFGVLVRASLENFVDQYLAHDPALEQEAHDLNNQCSLGVITYDEQIERFAEMAGISAEKTHQLMDNNPRNSALIDYIRSELHGRYKIGFLSNAGENWLEELFEKDDVALFDDVVLSYEYNMVKPDPRIYELAAERLNLAPEECVFVDDIYSYVEGAKAVGMHAFQYKNLPSLKKSLATVL